MTDEEVVQMFDWNTYCCHRVSAPMGIVYNINILIISDM